MRNNTCNLCARGSAETFVTSESSGRQFVRQQRLGGEQPIIVTTGTKSLIVPHIVTTPAPQPKPTKKVTNLRYGKINVRISGAENVKAREEDGSIIIRLG